MLTKREEKKFEQIPLNLKPIAEKLLKLQLSEIPANPKVNQWYRYSPEEYVCANGDPYHGLYKIGKEVFPRFLSAFWGKIYNYYPVSSSLSR